jgi:hypothetical protein
MVTDQKVQRTLFASRLLLSALLLNISLGLSYIGLWFMAAQQDLFWRADFSAFYTGWSIAGDGQGAHLYDPDLQMPYQRRFLQGRSFKDGLLPYVNPPHLTIPFVPLSVLPLTAAYFIWTLGQVALLVWLLRLLSGLARSWQPYERWLLLSAVVAFPALMLSFLLGAFSLFLTICLVQFYLSLKSGRAGRAGLWLVLGTIKPQAVLLVGVLLLAARRWRTLLSALLIGGVLVLFSIVMLGWQTWPDYFRLLRSHTGLFDSFGVVPADMHNLKGTLTLILGNDKALLINQISYVALAASVALTFWLWYKRWRPDDPSFELKMAFALLLGLLFSVHLNPQDTFMLIVPATLFYVYLRQRGLPRRAYAAFALISPLVILFSETFLGGALGVRVPVLAMMVLGVWIGKALYNQRIAQ